jgi:hypothetical protein
VRDTAGITALTFAINRDRQPAIDHHRRLPGRSLATPSATGRRRAWNVRIR